MSGCSSLSGAHPGHEPAASQLRQIVLNLLRVLAQVDLHVHTALSAGAFSGPLLRPWHALAQASQAQMLLHSTATLFT